MHPLATLFVGIPTSIISDSMRRIAGPRSLTAYHGSAPLLGTAYTVRVRAGDNLYIHDSLRKAQAGDVLVIDGAGNTDRALLGEIMMSVPRMRGLAGLVRSEEHTSELHSLMRISYAVFCLKKKKQ